MSRGYLKGLVAKKNPGEEITRSPRNKEEAKQEVSSDSESSVDYQKEVLVDSDVELVIPQPSPKSTAQRLRARTKKTLHKEDESVTGDNDKFYPDSSCQHQCQDSKISPTSMMKNPLHQHMNSVVIPK